MKSILASILALNLLFAPAGLAQSSEEPAPDETVTESAPAAPDMPSLAPAVEIPVAPNCNQLMRGCSSAVDVRPSDESASRPAVQATLLSSGIGYDAAPWIFPAPKFDPRIVASAPPNGVPQAVNAIPSPAGSPLFTGLSETNSPSGEAALELRMGTAATFKFNCRVGMCEGTAVDVWRAMPPQQKEPYLAAVVQVLARGEGWAQGFAVSVRPWPQSSAEADWAYMTTARIPEISFVTKGIPGATPWATHLID